MELAMGALEIAMLAQKLPFSLGREGHVHRRGLAAAAHLGEPLGEQSADLVGLLARAREEAAAGRWRERHRHLELGIVAAAGALVGVGPAMIEHIFALR